MAKLINHQRPADHHPGTSNAPHRHKKSIIAPDPCPTPKGGGGRRKKRPIIALTETPSPARPAGPSPHESRRRIAAALQRTCLKCPGQKLPRAGGGTPVHDHRVTSPRPVSKNNPSAALPSRPQHTERRRRKQRRRTDAVRVADEDDATLRALAPRIERRPAPLGRRGAHREREWQRASLRARRRDGAVSAA
jgi:hypothetical protein